MIPSFENRHSLGGRACPMFGGDSSSSSTSEQTTNNNYSDSRSVLGIDDHTVNTALSDSFNTSTALDGSFNTDNSNKTALSDSFNTTDNSAYTSALADSFNTNTKTAIADSFNTSSSVSSSTNYTQNTSTTDFGAVSSGATVSGLALKFGETLGLSALNQNSLNFNALLDVADGLFSKTKNTTDANLSMAGELSKTASAAYSDATAQATGNKNLIMATIAMIGIVAFVSMRK